MPRSETYEEFWLGNTQRLRNALGRFGIEVRNIEQIIENYEGDTLSTLDIGTILRCEEWIESSAQWQQLNGNRNSQSFTVNSRHRSRWENEFKKIDVSSEFQRNPHKEYVGLEIEVNDSRVKMHLENADIPNWDCVHDGSLDCGSEFRLRNVLRGDDLLREIENFCITLHKRNYQMDNTCSVHVHIDAKDMKLSQVKTLIHLHRRYEQFLYGMLDESRTRNRFCLKTGHTILPESVAFTPLDDAMKTTNLYEFKREYYAGNPDELSTHKYYDGRYSGLNVHSLFLNGTIELRHLEGTLDAKKINAWVLLNLAMVDLAKKGLTRKQIRALHYTNKPIFREFVNLLPDDMQIVFEKYYAKQNTFK